MKRSIMIAALVMAGGLPLTASAQVMLQTEQPLVNQYINDSFAQRSRTWWNALEKQLLLTVDVPTAEINEVALQNIIFFATHHKRDVNLRRALPSLIDVYADHEEEGMRIMALAAIDAIGDPRAERRVREIAEDDASERTRRLAGVVVANLTTPYPM